MADRQIKIKKNFYLVCVFQLSLKTKRLSQMFDLTIYCKYC